MSRQRRRPSSSIRPALIEALDARQLLHAPVTGLKDLHIIRNAAPTTINLNPRIHDESVEGTVVDMVYNVGTVRVALLDKTAPTHVANFLKYVDANRYDNTIIHRSVSDFIIQGGGYLFESPFAGTHITNFSPVADDYKLPNVRGTLAFAKPSTPNSATSEYFINLGDNTNSLSPEGQKSPQNPAGNGGFTVFAKVVNNMTAVDKIAAVPVYNAGSGTAFETLPLVNYKSGTATKDNFVILQDVARVPLTASAAKVTVASSNSSIVSAKITGSRLVLTYGKDKTGSAKITVSTVSVDGDVSKATFTVKVSTPTTGTLSGTVFLDSNKDKKLNNGEHGLAGWRVYIDTDGDGRRDKNEPSVLSDANGGWTFSSLRAGTYTVRIGTSSGYKNTMSTTLTLTVKVGETSGGKFGFRKV